MAIKSIGLASKKDNKNDNSKLDFHQRDADEDDAGIRAANNEPAEDAEGSSCSGVESSLTSLKVSPTPIIHSNPIEK